MKAGSDTERQESRVRMRNKKTVRQRDKNAGFDTQEGSDTKRQECRVRRRLKKTMRQRETRKQC